MTALIEKIASTTVSRKLAQFLIPHKHNNHHPYLLRHESLFLAAFSILVLQFFSFAGVSGNNVLGYGTDINKDKIIALTNQERTSRGLNPLKESSLLNTSAFLKGEDMFAKDYWAHFAPDGTSPWYFFKKVGYKYTWAGENLARDFATSNGVVAGWMASQGHRDNMLNPDFTEIGISVQNGTLQGEQTTLVVEHLATPKEENKNPNPLAASQKKSNGELTTLEEGFNSQIKKSPTVSSAAKVDKIQEKIVTEVKNGFNFNAFWQNLSFGQKSTIFLLAILLALFLFDSFVILRKGVERHNSHSFLHALVIGILLIAIVRGSLGGIL